MDFAEDLSSRSAACSKRRRELKVLERDISKLERSKAVPAHHYDDAVTLLQGRGRPIEWGGDFGGPDETICRNSTISR